MKSISYYLNLNNGLVYSINESNKTLQCCKKGIWYHSISYRYSNDGIDRLIRNSKPLDEKDVFLYVL